jgi:Spy/CpxP family protein refolding chaperone
MKRVAAIAAALMVVSGLTFAEEKAAAEKPAETTAAVTQAPKGQADRAAAQEQMWKQAGLSDEEIAKMKELRQQFFEARKAKDMAKMKEIQAEMDKIMTPERKEKIRAMRPAKKDNKTTSAK